MVLLGNNHSRTCSSCCPVNPAPVSILIHYHGRHNSYEGNKVKAEIFVFTGSLDDEDQVYVGDEENAEEGYID